MTINLKAKLTFLTGYLFLAKNREKNTTKQKTFHHIQNKQKQNNKLQFNHK